MTGISRSAGHFQVPVAYWKMTGASTGAVPFHGGNISGPSPARRRAHVRLEQGGLAGRVLRRPGQVRAVGGPGNGALQRAIPAAGRGAFSPHISKDVTCEGSVSSDAPTALRNLNCPARLRRSRSRRQPPRRKPQASAPFPRSRGTAKPRAIRDCTCAKTTFPQSSAQQMHYTVTKHNNHVTNVKLEK